jgi:diguanylate cyclase (GGDEF)-like protein
VSIGDGVITTHGRPSERQPSFNWGTFVVRLVALAWGTASAVALVDAFHALPHLSFFTAMGMTLLLVAVTWIVTHQGVPDWRGEPVDDRREAHHDDAVVDLLTKLPTFAHFQRRLTDEFGRSRRMGKQVSVVLIDVNNLTAVNKEYGVTAGDEVLRHVATAVDGTRRYNDVVARLGDDEFGVLLLDCGDQGVSAFVERLEERLARESALAEVSGRMISLWAGVCTGSATSEPAVAEPDALLQAAMANLNGAKQDRERRRRMWLSA